LLLGTKSGLAIARKVEETSRELRAALRFLAAMPAPPVCEVERCRTSYFEEEMIDTT
jgi:hypothetical protein